MAIGKILQHRQPEFPGWKLLADGEQTVDYTTGHLDSILKNIMAGSFIFVLARPEAPVQNCHFLQVCADETLPYFYVEISLAQPDGGWVLYGKGRFTAAEVQALLADVAGKGFLPEVNLWEKVAVYPQIYDREGYRRLVRMLTEDETVRSHMEQCIEDPRKWFDRSEYEYDGRGTAIIPDLDTICRETLAGELLGQGLAVEIRPGDGPEEFLPALAALAREKGLPLNPEWFRPDQEGAAHWLAVLEEQWQPAGYLPAALYLDEESPLIFPWPADRMTELEEAAAAIGHRVTPARAPQQP